MAKVKGSGSYPNPKGHTGPKMQFPQAKKPGGGNTAPRILPRTRSSPKGR